MSLRFFRRIRLAPGITVNLSRSGASLSFGPRGARLTLGRGGVRGTAGLPGTGLYYTRRLGKGKGRGRRAAASPEPVEVSAEARLRLGFFRRLVIPAGEEALVDGLRELAAGREEAAFGHLREATGLADGAFLAGLLALKRERLGEAQAWLEAALGAHRRLGHHLARYRVQATLALPITAELTAWIEPGLRAALLALVECHQLAGRRSEALACLERLRRLEPEDRMVRASLAELLLEEPEPSRAACRRVVRLAEGVENEGAAEATLLLYAGRALRRLGLEQAAVEVLGRALRRRKGRSAELLHALRYERALAREALGRRAAARRDLERLYAEAPDYADVAARLGL